MERVETTKQHKSALELRLIKQARATARGSLQFATDKCCLQPPCKQTFLDTMPPFSIDEGNNDARVASLSGVVDSPSRSSFRVTDGLSLSPSSKYPISPISERATRFNPCVEVHEIPDIDDYTDEEAFGTWYSYNELQLILIEVKELARRINRSANSSSPTSVMGGGSSPVGTGRMAFQPPASLSTLKDVECIRGLEERLTQRSLQIHHVRINALYAVMSEQYNQQQQFEQRHVAAAAGRSARRPSYTFVYDDERIRNVYQSISVHCLRDACDVATRDAYEAHCYQQEGLEDEEKKMKGKGMGRSSPYDDDDETDSENALCWGVVPLPVPFLMKLFNPSTWWFSRIESSTMGDKNVSTVTVSST